MPVIKLTRGMVARVDWRDYRIVSELRWHAHQSRDNFYAYASLGKRKSIAMHRLIFGLKKGDPREVDHLNHDTLDNRRRNLKVCTRRKNHENRKYHSRYGIGIAYRPEQRRRKNPFTAMASVDSSCVNIGYFATAEEARAARRKFLKEIERK